MARPKAGYIWRLFWAMENVKNGYAQTESVSTENNDAKLTPERARSILMEGGMEVSLDQAETILAFLRRLASICNSNHNQDGWSKGLRLLIEEVFYLGIIGELVQKQQCAHHFQDGGNGKRYVGLGSMEDFKECADKIQAISEDQNTKRMFCFHAC